VIIYTVFTGSDQGIPLIRVVNLILVYDREENIGRFHIYDIIANLPAAYQRNDRDLKAHARLNVYNSKNPLPAIAKNILPNL
jgi:hypothetical protein